MEKLKMIKIAEINNSIKGQLINCENGYENYVITEDLLILCWGDSDNPGEETNQYDVYSYNDKEFNYITSKYF